MGISPPDPSSSMPPRLAISKSSTRFHFLVDLVVTDAAGVFVNLGAGVTGAIDDIRENGLSREHKSADNQRLEGDILIPSRTVFSSRAAQNI